MRKVLALMALSAASTAGLSFLIPQAPSVAATTSSHSNMAPKGSISVLSYNIKGLPWPIAKGRTEALSEIGERLTQLRALGNAPNIVVLQEGFIAAAATIQQQGGYKYAAAGPAADYRSETFSPSPSKKFTETASALRGETEGKYLNSGLRIFSDFPIIKVEGLAFPEYACAGYDCLANKGILLAWVKVPNYSKPIAIVDTHLNSREASGVSDERSNAAWVMQAEIVMRFVHDKIPSSATVIFTGDLNIGQVPARIQVNNDRGDFLPGGSEALRLAIATDKIRDDRQLDEVRWIIGHAKDWQWFRSGATKQLNLIDVSVPFGVEPDGTSLSDHLGYIANYRLTSKNLGS